jgi:hypothetical protein
VLRTPVAHRHHSGSITITVIRYGERGPDTHDFSSLNVPQIYPTLLQAQEDADHAVREADIRATVDVLDGRWRREPIASFREKDGAELVISRKVGDSVDFGPFRRFSDRASGSRQGLLPAGRGLLLGKSGPFLDRRAIPARTAPGRSDRGDGTGPGAWFFGLGCCAAPGSRLRTFPGSLGPS